MADRNARIDALLDKAEILDCLTRFCRGSDRRDRALFIACCHPDAIISVGPFVGSAAELYDWSDGMAATNNGTMHNLLNFTCDLDGDSAHSETYYFFTQRNLDGSNVLAGGRYIDRFERRDGEWKLLVRNNFIEWSSVVAGLDNPLNQVADLLANGTPSRGPDDISYTRPLVNVRARNVPG